MRIVGLTGGIASGKSTASRFFGGRGIPVVDADVIARHVLMKGTRGWKRVVAAFGQDFLLPNGEVDRAKLGHVVFCNPDMRQLLNRVLAPFISNGMMWEVMKLWMKGHEVIIMDVPLLFEAKMNRWTDPVIVIWVDRETQLRRLMVRDNLASRQEAEHRLSAQIPLDEKKDMADIVVDNTGSHDDLNEQLASVLSIITAPLTPAQFLRSRRAALLLFLPSILLVCLCRRWS